MRTLLVRNLLMFVSILKHDPLAQRHYASHCRRAHDLIIELLKAMRPQILLRLLITLLACSLISGRNVRHEPLHVSPLGDHFT
jgi:hypothetical protein